MRKTLAACGISLILSAGALRIVAAMDDFWFDEIFSWHIAMNVNSPAEIFTSPAARIDNNHPLNTLFMYALGDRHAWQSYRMLSIICGMGAVVLAGWAMRWRMPDALFALALLGFSYPLILYSSEARGYAPMIVFMLAALIALRRGTESRQLTCPVLYALACILGVLSHLTFLQFYLAAIVWSAIVWKNPRKILIFNVVPLLAIVVIYLIFVRHLSIAGGPDASLLETVAATLSLLIGGSEHTLGLGVVGAVMIVASLVFTYRVNREWFYLALFVFLAAPAFLFVQFVILNHRETIFPRYFLVPVIFALLLFAETLGEMWRRSRLARTLAIFALAIGVAGNLWQTAQFLHFGRGHYSDAIQLMAAQTEGPLITITTERDQEFRVQPMLAFYERYLPPGKKLAFNRPMSPSLPAPQWLIINTKDVAAPLAPDGVEIIPNHRWMFIAEFPYYGLSGWAWQLYRVESGPLAR